MMIEKNIQDVLINILKYRNLDYIHLGNVGKKSRTQNKCLTYFPDVQFCFNSQTYIVEFGIKDGNSIRHSDRKKNQIERAHKMERDGGMIFAMIFTHDELNAFIDTIGLA